MKAFGHDFNLSTKFAELIYRCALIQGLWQCCGEVVRIQAA
jgi:hypothetical protein